MTKHTKIYLDHFDCAEDQYIKCEIPYCQSAVVDVHHIDSKGMGGTSEDKDYIENLCGVCRKHHNQAHADIQFNSKLKHWHLKWLEVFATFSQT